MRVNLAAYTLPGCHYPPYFSVNMWEADECVEITIRSAPVADYPGPVVALNVPVAEFKRLVAELAKAVEKIP